MLFRSPVSLSAHILIVCITHLELMISCWTWSVISKLWLFPSQLLSKACSGGNQLFSPSASRIGPSSVPWVCTWVPGLETAGDSHRGIGTIGALRQGCPQVAQKRGGHCGWKRRSKVKVRDRCAWTPQLGRRRAFSWKLENPRGILN